MTWWMCPRETEVLCAQKMKYRERYPEGGLYESGCHIDEFSKEGKLTLERQRMTCVVSK